MTESPAGAARRVLARLLAALGLTFTVVGVPSAVAAWAGTTAGDVDAAARRFERSGVRSYVVDVEQSCFCAFADEVRVLRVFVADGRIARVQGWTGSTRTSDAAPEPATLVFDTDRIPREHRWARPFVPLPRAYRTIATTTGRADEARARFDRRTGWPRSFSVDPIAKAVDDEYTITWRRVAAADAAAGVAPGRDAQG